MAERTAETKRTTRETEMGPRHVVTDRPTMQEKPPDILLTNYKMLDFLLLRPEEQPLWRNNAPETLRFLVVDELHTYRGRQGADVPTDLAPHRKILPLATQVERRLVQVVAERIHDVDAERRAGAFVLAGDGIDQRLVGQHGRQQVHPLVVRERRAVGRLDLPQVGHVLGRGQ
jgi:hypothetical protein